MNGELFITLLEAHHIRMKLYTLRIPTAIESKCQDIYDNKYKIYLDSLHRRLCLNARFTGPEDSKDNLDFQTNPYMECKPFQHRNLKTRYTFTPVGTPTLEAFKLNNEHDFIQHPAFRANGENNLTTREFKAIGELQSLSDK